MKKFLFPLIICLSNFVYGDTGLDAARTLAGEDIIIDQSLSGQSETQEIYRYRLDDPILRQEVLGIALKLWGTNTDNIYRCQGYFVDIDESWVCRAAELAADYNIITRANIYFRPKDTLTFAEAMGITMNALKISLSNSSTLSISGRLPGWQKRLILTIKEQQIKLDIRDKNGRGIASYNPEIGIRVSDFDMSHKMTRGEFFQLVIALRNPNQSFSCYDYRYSTCPNSCEKRCVSSNCTGTICTADCDGIGSCIPKQNTSSTCYDSDGDNPNIAGYVQLDDVSFGVNGKKYDVCDGNFVREYICLNSTTYGGEKSYNCANGCANGACKSSSGGIYDHCTTYSDGCNDCSTGDEGPICTKRYCFWQGIPKCYTCETGYTLQNDRCVKKTGSCIQEGQYAGGGEVYPPENPADFVCCSGLTKVWNKDEYYIADGGKVCIRQGDGYCDSRYESSYNSSDCTSVCKKEGEAVSNRSLPPEYQFQYTCCSGLTEVSPATGGVGGNNICAKIGDGYCDTRYESIYNSSDCQDTCTKEGDILYDELAPPPGYPSPHCCSGLTRVNPKDNSSAWWGVCAKIGDGYCDTRYESTINSSDCRTSTSLDTSICQSYYDGCNTCSRSSNGQVVCTLLYCIAIVRPAYCTSYIPYTQVSQSQDSAFLTKISTEIKNYVSDLSCTDSSQCKYRSFGDGACNPDMFIRYSTKNIDTTLLTEKTTYYTNAKKLFNETYTPWYKNLEIHCPLYSPLVPLVCTNGICY